MLKIIKFCLYINIFKFVRFCQIQNQPPLDMINYQPKSTGLLYGKNYKKL